MSQMHFKVICPILKLKCLPPFAKHVSPAVFPILVSGSTIHQVPLIIPPKYILIISSSSWLHSYYTSPSTIIISQDHLKSILSGLLAFTLAPLINSSYSTECSFYNIIHNQATHPLPLLLKTKFDIMCPIRFYTIGTLPTSPVLSYVILPHHSSHSNLTRFFSLLGTYYILSNSA